MAAQDPLPSRRRVLVAGLGAAAFTVMGGACASEARSPADGRTSTSADAPPGDRADRVRVPEPAGFVRTSWSTDARAGGSYSYLPVGAPPTLRTDLAAPVGGVLWFAGEATSTESPSTVHGAQRSGADAAHAIDQGADGPLDVVVVGAGVAGARAARDLDAAGHRVIVVEAEPTSGGRTRTVRPDGWPVPVELGASWVHDTSASDLADQLDALGVATTPFAYDDVVLTSTGRRSDAESFDGAAAAALEAAVEWAAGQDEDCSLADALVRSGAADDVDPATVDHVLRTEVTTEYGADGDEISAWWGLEEGTEGDDLLVTGGYGALAERDLAGIDARYDWTVESIAIRDGAVSVVGGDGEELRADRVVMTVALGALQAGAIEFDPPLPAETQRAIDELGMGVLDKVWLRWDEPWWTEEAEQWTLVAAADEPYVEWFNLLPATGAPVLLGLVGGGLARAWADRTDDEVLTAALRTLGAFADAGW